MMRLIILSAVIISSLGAPPPQQTLSVNEDGTYEFSYETGKEGGSHFRTESKGPDGTVVGKYSYQDPLGELRVVNYRADDNGFLASEDGEVPQPSASEVPEKPEEAVKAEVSEKDDEKQKEETKSSLTAEATEEDDDEEKPLKLEEPVYDGPPEGFPPGFFSEQFSALRRLPEPKKEDKSGKKKNEGKANESSTDEVDKAEKDESFRAGLHPEAFPPGFFLHHFTGLRRFEEPTNEQESAENTKSDDSNSAAFTSGEKTLIPGTYSSYILPFPSFVPPLWPSSPHHNPVYVYSHQQPNAYTYGYYY